MTTILSLNDWFEITSRGTSGDQVSDILYSWKAQVDEWSNGFVSQECEWEYQDDEGYYETKCGYSFYFLEGENLTSNKTFKYCPYCGKSIKETFVPLEDDICPDCEGAGEVACEGWYNNDGMTTCERCGGKGIL